MKLRYSYLILCIAVITLGFFVASRGNDVSIFSIGAMSATIVSLTLSAIGLALFSLRSVSLIYITRNVAIPIIVITLLNRPNTLFSLTILLGAILQLSFYSETIISRITRKISLSNEDMFILKSPLSVFMWFTIAWTVVWLLFIETIHLLGTSHNIVGVITILLGLVIIAAFISPQLRILYRRAVLVPQGIVLSDHISMTDVVLFPLAKISTVELTRITEKSDEVFSFITSIRNTVLLSLTQKVDSLIVRKGVGQTERVNVDKIAFSPADSKQFVALFHQRFHKIEPEELSRSKEILMEKQLGIKTAPRSDTPLPQHRKNKMFIDDEHVEKK